MSIPLLALGIGVTVVIGGVAPLVSAGDLDLSSKQLTIVGPEAAALTLEVNARTLPSLELDSTEIDGDLSAALPDPRLPQAATRSGDKRTPISGDDSQAPGTSVLDRPTPTTPEEAKAAWMAAGHEVEVVNQSVLRAEELVAKAKTTAQQTAARAERAELAVTTAEQAVTQAQADVAALQAQLTAFASASFRGARLNQISSLLTAESAEDFLDQSSTLDQLAANSQRTMAAFQAAKATAVSRQDEATAAQAAATKIAEAAAQEAHEAEQAAAALVQRRSDLTAMITKYRALIDQLTISERADAIAAYENSNLTAQTAQRFAAQAAVRAQAGISETDKNLTEVLDLANTAPDRAAAVAVTAALTTEGLPYVWGAVGPNTFDCSGLMMWAWAEAGYSVPRTSAQQANLPEVPMDQLQPGDLVTYYSPVTHVGMYIGHGLVIHASTEGVPIKVADVYKAGPNPTGHRVPR